MMKKYFGILLCVFMLFSFIGCNKSQKANANSLDNSQTSSTVHSEVSSSEPIASSASSSQQSNKLNSHLASFTEGNTTFKLPDTYHKSGDNPILYVPSDYPKVSDNFNLTITQKDPNFKQLTKEIYQKQLETILSSVNISEFEPTTISEYPAIKISYSCTYNGVSLEQLQYSVDGDKLYSFSYTFVNGDLKDYADNFAESISIKK